MPGLTWTARTPPRWRRLPAPYLALGLLLAAVPLAARAAPLGAPSVGVTPGSGPPGMSVTVFGSDWTMSNSPYKIFWDAQGGTELGTFAPDASGNWSQGVTIPSGASAGGHTIIACEGYTTEFQQCASTGFTVVVATSPPTATRTRTPSPSPSPVPPGVTPSTSTPSPTATSLGGCIDGVNRLSPPNTGNLGGIATVDLVMEAVLGDPTAQHVRIYVNNDRTAVYTQWPDPLPGTTVEAVPDSSVPNRWTLTVRDYPLVLGYNEIKVDLNPSCWRVGATYYQLVNGTEPTPTPRPDVCGGLGFPADATIINFDTYSRMEDYQTRLQRDQGLRFEGSLQLLQPTAVHPRSAFGAGASIEGLEFGSVMLPIRMAFDRPLQAVGLFVGLPDALYVRSEVTAVLSAYGYRGGTGDLVRLGSDSTTFPPAPTDIIHCLRFEAAPGDIIARALVEYTEAGGSIAERRLIDDLTLVYAEAELPVDRPPEVEITGPPDGSSIGAATVNLRALIREDRELVNVFYQLDGGPETRIGASPSITDPTSYSTGVNFSSSLLSAGASHVLTVTAWDRAGQFGTDSISIIIPTPVPTIDLQVTKLEVVQVVQCLDNAACNDNAVPLITNKPTWARVYVRSEGGIPARTISGRLCQGRVTACATGFVLPFNEIQPDGDPDPSVDDRGRLEASLNFILPPAWLLEEGPLELTAFVNYEEEDLDETRMDNNLAQAELTVIPARTLTVMFMPVTADGVTAPLSEMWSFADWLTRVFPVSRVVPIARAPLPGDFDLSDSSGDNCGRTWDRLMDALRGAYSWGGASRAYLFGLVPREANTDGVGGCGETPGRVASGITSPGTREGPRIAAQELGHNFGRRHAPGCDAGGPDGSYPNPRRSGRLDDWGLDLALRQLYAPASSFDYMGYCGGVENSWTSVYTYLAVLGQIPVAQGPASGPRLAARASADGGPILIGGGLISPESFQLEHGFYRTTLAQGSNDGLPVGPYTVQLQDIAGGVLSERDFGLIPLSNSESSDGGFFHIILPDVPETAQIVFRYGGQEIGRVSASPNPPQVRLLSPAGGEDWSAGGVQTVAWEASDPDGDRLRFTLLLSSDGGVSWSPVVADLSGATSVSVDTANLPGGSLVFRLLASDGLNTAVAESSAPVTLTDKPPMMHLAAPADGDAFPTGETVVFRGFAMDLEDVVLEDSAYRWSSNVDGDLGSGPTLWAVPMSPGAHQVTLTVTDRDGNAVSQSVAITVGVPLGEAGGPPRPTTALGLLLILAGGAFLLISAGGIAYFLLRGRRA